ncbi:AmmeMemoRadiSam system protein A [Vibrio maritimus]|uniref:AmmeMemoRadiSam system protein A n=1 Tax=Vibrio maritimus TaxID=990268 RepID=UPI0040696D75
MSATQYQDKTLTNTELSRLLDMVEVTVGCYLAEEPLPKIRLEDHPEAIREKGACFVTLHVDDQLQGCIGTTVPQVPLVLEVMRKAWASCCQDKRFLPLQKSQVDGLEIEVSVLTEPQTLDVASESALIDYLKNNKCGLTLSDGKKGALFLPQVWEQLPSPIHFLQHLKQKADWHPTYWPEDISVKVFDVQKLSRKYRRM